MLWLRYGLCRYNGQGSCGPQEQGSRCFKDAAGAIVDSSCLKSNSTVLSTRMEYHTSADNLSLITPNGLAGGLAMIQKIIKLLEINHFYKATNIGEPQLGRRGLYPNLSQKGSAQSVRAMMNLLAYADGSVDLLHIADSIEEDVFVLAECANLLAKNNLLIRNNMSS